MTSFSTAMKEGKNNSVLIAGILTVVVIAILSGYLVYTYYPDILDNLFPDESPDIEIGDCADVNYIGRFYINNSVFDTSYESVAIEWDIYNENRDYEPLKIFVDPSGELEIPEDCEGYSSGMIQGFLKGLIGMEKGENKTVIIPPEEAYGDWNVTLAESMGAGSYYIDSIINISEEVNISVFQSSFPDTEIVLNESFDYGLVAFQSEGILNATIINITNTNLTFEIDPKNGTIFTHPIFSTNTTILVDNDVNFTIHMDFTINQTFNLYGVYFFKVVDVNETVAKFAINMNAPDITFIGQTLVFELEVIEVYKNS